MKPAPAPTSSPASPHSRVGPWGDSFLALEPLWLLLLSPLILFPGRLLPFSLHWIPVLALLIFWPLRLPLQGRVTPPTPVRPAAAVFLLTFIPALWASADRMLSWESAGYHLLGIAAANALVNLPRLQRRPEWLGAALLLMAAGLSLLGPLIVTDTGSMHALLAAVQRAAGPITILLGETINPNIMAHALLVVFPLALALLLRGGWTERRWLRPVLLLFVIWLLAVFYITQSRGAWLALAVVIPLLLMLRLPKLAWLALPLLAVAAGFAWWRGPVLLELLTTSTATTGIAERLEIWQRALFAVQDFPFTGLGLGTFARVVPLLYPWLLIAPDVVIPDAHNLPLQVAVDLGIVGFGAWLALQVGLFVMMGRVVRRNTTPLRWALAAGVLGSLAATQAAGIFGAINWGVKPTFIAWMVVALAVLVHRQESPGPPFPPTE